MAGLSSIEAVALPGGVWLLVLERGHLGGDLGGQTRKPQEPSVTQSRGCWITREGEGPLGMSYLERLWRKWAYRARRICWRRRKSSGRGPGTSPLSLGSYCPHSCWLCRWEGSRLLLESLKLGKEWEEVPKIAEVTSIPAPPPCTWPFQEARGQGLGLRLDPGQLPALFPGP